MKKINILSRVKSQMAFTMIELLIVIAILGILAVAVLAAINPIEQINRGRDTGSRSDAEQLLSAINRFYAYKGYYPWVSNPNNEAALAWRGVAGSTSITVGEGSIEAWGDNQATPCYVLDKISSGNADGTCAGTNEIKTSFVDRIIEPDYNHLYVYYSGEAGDSLYVCFQPQSGAMKEEAADRCTSGLPDDIDETTAGIICTEDAEYVCLP